jgi:Flp pilus assembly protein TadG
MQAISDSRKRRQRGSGLLEGALTVSMFTGLVLSVLDFGQLVYMHQALSERVRWVARRAAIYGWSETTVKSYVAYNRETAPDGGAGGYFGLRASNVQVTYPDGNSNAARMMVRVSGLSYPLVTPWFGRNSGTNMPIEIAAPLEVP